MKILFAASEAVPFCKTGGLADVVGALPEILAAKRHAVRLILPYYQQIKNQFPQIKFTGQTVQTSFDGQLWPVRILETEIRPNLRVYFADTPEFFDRPGIYGPNPGIIFPDNDRRYAFFSRTILDIAKAVNFQPDILHLHDWQTGLTAAYLKFLYRKDPFFVKVASVFTIHNMAYQGIYPAPSFHLTGLPTEAYNLKGLEFYGKVSFLKAGLVYSDALNTVSPTYAQEISTDPTFGCGMEGVLKERSADFTGILNGLDVKFWDPKTDTNLIENFDKENLEERAACKADLQALSHFPIDSSVPLLGFIGRLDYQKGIDLLIETIPSLLKEGVQFVSLGQGNLQYTKDLMELERRFPSQVFVKTEFAELFAHKIYAGADIFLMPSRYEPCGLGQLIAMRYGAVPVVTPTGGLIDTVKPVPTDPNGTGFVSPEISAADFQSTVRSALKVWNDKPAWQALQQRAMQQDFSWRNPVQEYLMLYESLLK